MSHVTSPALVHQHADGTEEHFILHKDTISIGRSDTCTIVIQAPLVSRLHARIECRIGQYILFDVDSANGVFVNGRRIQQSQHLNDRDEIWLGSSDTVIIFSLPPSQSAPTPETRQAHKTPPQMLKEFRETNVVNALTSTSIHKNPDAFFTTRLPVLQVALDMEYMTPLLVPLLAPLAAPNVAPRVHYAKLLTYKQGNRGLIHYEIKDLAFGSVVYGKLYPEAAQASRMHKILSALWSGGFAHTSSIKVPQPLGYIPNLSIQVYVPAEGRFLAEEVNNERGLEYADLIGRWLYTLHQQDLPLDKHFQLRVEQVQMQAATSLVSHKYPHTAEIVRTIAQHLQNRARNLQLETHVPIHSDLHYGHIIVGQALSVVDFDEMRFGDPNFDLAHFNAYLALLAHRQGMTPLQLARFQNAFLSAYASESGWSPNERYVYFYAATCLKIAKLLCSGRGLRPRPEGNEQQQQVHVMIERALMILNEPAPPQG